MVSLILLLAVGNPSIAGTWIADASDPVVRGQIEVDTENRTAWFRGERLSFVKHGNVWRAELDDGSALLEARWRDGLEGFWLQRRPGGTTFAWATPVRFERRSSRRWVGWVRPFDERHPVILRLSASNAGGAFNVLARDPAANRTLRLGLTTARRDGSKVIFHTKSGPTLTADLIDEGQRMLLALPSYSKTLVFRRALNPFGLRARRRPAPGLRMPTPDDHWAVTSLEAADLDRGQVEGLTNTLKQQATSSPYDPMVQALLVARRGRLVVEEYFYGFGSDQPHDLRSAGKSLASMLVGAVALRLGRDPVRLAARPFCGLAQGFAPACGDRRKATITLGHLLSMRSGLDCDDDNYDSPGNEDRMQTQTAEPDWYRYAIGVPMAHPPGRKAVYCTAGINLAGAALRGLTGRRITELFDEHLARPLGIRHYHHNLFGDGEGYLGGGMRLRPRDLLKFGEVMRLSGTYNGQRILPKHWVDVTTRAHGSIHEPGDYGFGWWRYRVTASGQQLPAYYASGNGGQLLFVVPDRGLVALFLGGNYGNFGTWKKFRDQYFVQLVRATR